MFSVKPGYGVPLLIILLTFILPVLFWRVLTGYYHHYVPYGYPLEYSGAEIFIIMSIVVLWLLASIFFQLLTDFPESLTMKYRCQNMYRKKGVRIIPAISYALIPLIICQVIGVAVLWLVLNSAVIVPPPTSAFEKYKDADAAYHSHSDDVWDRMDSAREMMMSMYPAEDEAAEGTRLVTSRLVQDPAIRTSGLALIILFSLALLWMGILLAYGIRYALDISLESSAVQVFFFIGGFTVLAYLLAHKIALLLW